MNHVLRLAVLTALVFAAMSVYLAIPSESDYWASASPKELAEESVKPYFSIFIGRHQAPREVGVVAKEEPVRAEPGRESAAVLNNHFAEPEPAIVAAEHADGEAGAPAPGDVVAEPPPPEAPPKASQTYTIEKGDTMTKIAARLCGSTKYADAIQKANPNVRPNMLIPGNVIVIPDVAGDDLDPAPAPQDPPRTTDAPPEPPRAKYKWVTIEKGNTLYGIARDHCGDVRKAKTIASLNKLRSGEKLPVGRKIKVPVES
jgi:LysM repeat protein